MKKPILTESDSDLSKLLSEGKDVYSEIKRLNINIFKNETDILYVSKENPIYKSIENYASYKKDINNVEIKDEERIFTRFLPKLERRDY